MLITLKRLSAFGLLLALAAPSTALGQAVSTEDLAAQIEELKKGQAQIREELKQIRTLLQQRQAARPSGPDVAGQVFDLGDNPVRGASSAPLTLVEFTDYQ